MNSMRRLMRIIGTAMRLLQAGLAIYRPAMTIVTAVEEMDQRMYDRKGDLKVRGCLKEMLFIQTCSPPAEYVDALPGEQSRAGMIRSLRLLLFEHVQPGGGHKEYH